MKLGYIGIDSYGNYTKLDKHPRKELMEVYGSNVSIMYQDMKDGSTEKVGYVINGNWITVYEVHSWES